MSMTFVEDLTAMFADFGVTATVNGVSARGIFDKDFLDTLGIVANTRPVLLVASTVSASVGQTVVVNSISYTIAEIQPNGTGLTLLVMK